MKAILYILSRAPACSSWDDKRCDSNMITIQEQEARPWDSTVELLQRDIPFSLAGPAHSLRYVVPLRGNWERRDWLKILGTSDTMNCVSGTTNSQSAPSSLCYIKSARPYRWLSQKELVKIKSGNPRGWSPDLVLQIIHWLCELDRITLTLWILVSSVVTLEARAWLGMIPTQEGCPHYYFLSMEGIANQLSSASFPNSCLRHTWQCSLAHCQSQSFGIGVPDTTDLPTLMRWVYRPFCPHSNQSAWVCQASHYSYHEIETWWLHKVGKWPPKNSMQVQW